jgi:hypothetical protein
MVRGFQSPLTKRGEKQKPKQWVGWTGLEKIIFLARSPFSPSNYLQTPQPNKILPDRIFVNRKEQSTYIKRHCLNISCAQRFDYEL